MLKSVGLAIGLLWSVFLHPPSHLIHMHKLYLCMIFLSSFFTSYVYFSDKLVNIQYALTKALLKVLVSKLEKDLLKGVHVLTSEKKSLLLYAKDQIFSSPGMREYWFTKHLNRMSKCILRYNLRTIIYCQKKKDVSLI